MVRVVSNRSGSYVMHMSLISPKNSVTFCTIWSCLPRSFFETRHFFWLANPAFQFCENIALQLLVGRSLATGVKSSPLCLDASSMLFSRSEEIQEKKLRQRSKQSPEDKWRPRSNVHGVEWFTLIQSPPPQHTKVANLLPASFVVQDLVSPR
jgi:hypothetical protein